MRQPLGQVRLPPAAGGNGVGGRGQILQVGDAQRAEPCEHGVQDVNGGPGVVERRWVGLTVARQTRARVESLTFGASSRVKTLRASLTVSSTRTFGQAMPSPAQAALRWPTSKAALWATRTVSGRARGTP